MRTGVAIWPIVVALLIGACGDVEPNTGEDELRAQREAARAERLKAACASPATYDRLKQVAFDEAIRMRGADSANLDTLSSHSLVRVEGPRVKSRDEAMDVTVCSGRLILQVPPGAERGFDGDRQLVADIEYAAQAAADGSGLVYQIDGADPIIQRLAAFNLRAQAYRPRAEATTVAQAETAAPAPASESVQPVPAEEAEPAPPPPPTRAPVEARRAPPVQAAPEPAREPARRAVAPSFNCRYARSRSERMVCGSDRLAALDREMSSQFYSALDRGDGQARAELRRTRDRFLRNRDRCDDAACVEQAYIDRMAEIRAIAADR